MQHVATGLSEGISNGRVMSSGMSHASLCYLPQLCKALEPINFYQFLCEAPTWHGGKEHVIGVASLPRLFGRPSCFLIARTGIPRVQMQVNLIERFQFGSFQQSGGP